MNALKAFKRKPIKWGWWIDDPLKFQCAGYSTA